MAAEQRHAPRLAGACSVEIEDRFGSWHAVTEDLGIRGCRLVSCRAPHLGSLVQLTLRAEGLPSPLRLAGQAIWARDGRVGVCFVGQLAGPVTPAAWIRDLAATLEDGVARAAPAAAPALAEPAEAAPRPPGLAAAEAEPEPAPPHPRAGAARR